MSVTTTHTTVGSGQDSRPSSGRGLRRGPVADGRANSRSGVRLGAIAAAAAVAWAGFFIHNVADLPGQTIASPESLFPTLIWLIPLALGLFPATRRAGAWALLVWSILNLIGGALSVLPLPFLPFEPEQTLRHYLFHGLYALSQLPLIALIWTWLRRS